MSDTFAVFVAALPAASVATALTVSFTDFARLSRFLALLVSFTLSLAMPETLRASVPMTVGFLPSLSFLAVSLSTTSWSLSVHGSLQEAVTARPLASTALSFCLAAFRVVLDVAVGAEDVRLDRLADLGVDGTGGSQRGARFSVMTRSKP